MVKNIINQRIFHNLLGAAYYYYKEAQEFTKRVRGTNYSIGEYGLSDLTGADAVDENTGDKLYEKNDDGGNTNQYKLGDYKIFAESTEYSIEDPESNFNQQRLAVIRYAIEKNLSIAINNYNHYANGVTTNFQMPKLKEDEWDKIVNNVSIISFLQGLNIGGKVYNGYSIITNNKNKEVVDEDSIYIVTRDNNQYHKANDKDLLDTVLDYTTTEGVLNLDFEIKSVEQNGDGNIISFLPRGESGCYSSIVTQSNLEDTGGNFYKYMQELSTKSAKGRILAQAYFTALGRERYSMYKLNNNADKLKQKFIQP